MEAVPTEAEFAMLLLSQSDLVQLGAMLGLRAQLGVAPGEEDEPIPPAPLAFDA